jgi:N utilization substance protein B
MPRQTRAGSRRQARIVALQTLYESDLAGHEAAEVLERHVEDRRLDDSIATFARELVEGVKAHQEEIDTRIEEAAPDWPLAQMARIDKNVLRLAIYEILYNNAVPARAAINEAVELAKRFGGDTSSRFVNGVLGAIVGQSIEPPPSPAGSEEP